MPTPLDIARSILLSIEACRAADECEELGDFIGNLDPAVFEHYYDLLKHGNLISRDGSLTPEGREFCELVRDSEGWQLIIKNVCENTLPTLYPVIKAAAMRLL